MNHAGAQVWRHRRGTSMWELRRREACLPRFSGYWIIATMYFKLVIFFAMLHV